VSLITCSDCGKQISDQAPACIHCGCPVQSRPQAQPQPSVQPSQPVQLPQTETTPPQPVVTQQAGPQPPTKQRSRAGQGVLAVIIIGILAGGAALVISHVFERSQKEKAATAREILSKEASRVAGEWFKEFEGKDQMTDSTNVGVRLLSDERIKTTGGDVHPKLRVGCLEGQPSVSIDPGVVVVADDSSMATARIRFPPKAAWKIKSYVNKGAAYIHHPAGFIHLLAKHSRLIVELTVEDLDNRYRTTFSFSLRGSPAAMKLIVDACGIPTPTD
jgi:hypothetical protein